MSKPVPRAKAILHPVRAQILIALHDRPLTPRQIAALMDNVPLGTVYRHINILHETGLIEVVRERRIYGTLERQFAVVESASYLSEEDREKLTAEDVMGLVTSLTGVVQAVFGRYVRMAEMPPKPGEVSFIVKSLYLTQEEYQHFRQQVQEMVTKTGRQPAPEYQRRLIGFFSTLDIEAPPPEETLPDQE